MQNKENIENRNSFLSNDEFDKIWDDVVVILIDDISKQYNLKVRNKKLLRILTKHLYKKYRNIFLKYYMYFDANKIDKHKVASCFTKSLLVVRPLYLSLKAKLSIRFSNEKCTYDVEEVLLANEYLALSVAITIIEGYIEAHNQNHDVAQPLNHKIVFPTPFPELDNEYLRDVCLDLYYTKPRKFNTITYANIFFLWEKYSCRKIQSENLESAYLYLLENPEYYNEISQSSTDEINSHIESIKFKEYND